MTPCRPFATLLLAMGVTWKLACYQFFISFFELYVHIITQGTKHWQLTNLLYMT